MYRFALEMTPDDVEAVATLLYVEMLEQGFTRVGEFHYLHHDRDGSPYADPAEMATRIAQAAESHRHRPDAAAEFLRARLLWRRSTACRPAPLHLLGRSVCQADGCLTHGRPHLPGANIGIAPHSLRAVTPDELAAIIPLAEGGPVHIHAAEQVREVEDCIAWSGRRPVEWLLEHAPVDQRWCLIHATHTTRRRSQRFREQRRGGRSLPGHRSEPRRRHFSGAGISRRRRPRSASAPIPTCWSASPTSCVSSNMASG